ncbi:hypothetical protein M758_11G157100 [Ceratodon purpureus]|nr:hypothetical protein M758_11G157100 [Ceratodon purpureus]
MLEELRLCSWLFGSRSAAFNNIQCIFQLHYKSQKWYSDNITSKPRIFPGSKPKSYLSIILGSPKYQSEPICTGQFAPSSFCLFLGAQVESLLHLNERSRTQNHDYQGLTTLRK